MTTDDILRHYAISASAAIVAWLAVAPWAGVAAFFLASYLQNHERDHRSNP